MRNVRSISMPALILRWTGAVPAVFAIATLAYFICVLADRIFGSVSLDFVAPIVTLGASYGAPRIAAWIAPLPRYAASGFAAILILLPLIYALTVMFLPWAQSHEPPRKVALLALLCAVGSIAAIVSEHESSFVAMAPSRVPEVVRWLLFLPLPTVMAAIVNRSVSAYGAYFAPDVAIAVYVDGLFLFVVIAVGLAATIAPRGKQVIAGIFGSCWIALGAFFALGPALISLLRSMQRHNPMDVSASAFLYAGPPGLAAPDYWMADGIALVAGGLLPIVIIVFRLVGRPAAVD
ncbi:MAG TPA: hypothetical protein VGD50_07260 [Candidatus Baltobacteraceae bacterium]